MSEETNFPPALVSPEDCSEPEGTGKRKLGKAARIVGWCSWVYLGFLLAVWALLYFVADRWWAGTLLLFGPRWLCLVPLFALIPAAAWLRPRFLLAPIPLSLFIASVPVTGLCVPWRPLVTRSSQPAIRVLTCNLHEAKEKDSETLAKLITETKPAIVALQNWHALYQNRVFTDAQWYSRREGELYVASRYPITSVERFRNPSITHAADAGRFQLQTPTGTIQLINVHLTTPRAGLRAILAGDREAPEKIESNVRARWQESKVVRELADQVAAPLLVAGDFNLPVESVIYRQFWGDYTDAFSTAGLGLGHTFYTRHLGVRIDHILGGPGWRCRRCWVGPNVGSPHLPVIADMEWLDVLR